MADLERYVSTTGKNGPGRGTENAPFRTIMKAAADLGAKLTPGQTGKILVEPGVYEEEVVVLTSNMQLLRKDGADQVTCDVRKESIAEHPSPVRLKRPPASSAPNTSSKTPTWTEVLKIVGHDIVVSGIRIEGDHRPQRAVHIHDSQRVRISGCVIEGGQTRIGYTGKGTGTPNDPFHSNVYEEGEGAGIRILRSTDVTLHNCLFSDNKTELKYQQAVIDDDVETLKASVAWFAAVNSHKIDPVEVERRLRQPQPVRNGGGHLSCFASHRIQVDNCVFQKGFCGGRGGAVQLAHDSSGSFERCLFRNNEAGVDGGAFAFSDPDTKDFARTPSVLKECTFHDNKAGDDGGAAYFTTNARVTLRACVFKSNSAASNGGAVRITFGSQVEMEECSFNDNQANTDFTSKLEKNMDGGGAIAVANASLSMRGGVVVGNRSNGFAGGGVYFITAAYDQKAEKVAEITHGQTFDNILKQGYKVTSAALTIKNVTFAGNKAEGETCYSDVCTVSPRTGFKAGGAGGAIYALGSLTDFNFPATVTLVGIRVSGNKSSHIDDNQKADLVFRNLRSLVVSDDFVILDASNKFAFSLIDVEDADMTASRDYAQLKAKGLVHESGSKVKP
jgi:hypothetical protein